MTQCSYENVSLIFCFCCVDMSQRLVRPDKVRLRRQQSSTSSARREKQAVHPPLVGRGEGGRDLGGLMMHGDHRQRQVHSREVP